MYIDGVREILVSGRQIAPKGAWPGSGAVLELLDPFVIAGTGEARNLKFGVWTKCVTY